MALAASMEQLTIVGVGLIGGSLALAARERRLARRIVGVDFWPTEPPDGLLDECVTTCDAEGVHEAMTSAELIVLALPVRAIQAALPAALDAAALGGAVITDCGSTKRAVIEAMGDHSARDRFVPGHPMAGHPEGGLANARADLFNGCRWLLCPEQASSKTALERVETFVRGLGACPVRLTAAEHDRAVAFTSHVPQLVASTLAVLVAEAEADVAAGPGYASATRVAGGAENMWRDIFVSNGDAVAAALSRLGARLGKVAEDLAQRPANPDGALALLAEARALRERRSGS